MIHFKGKTMNKVEVLHKIYTQCPECGKAEWWILLDKTGFEFEHIVAFKCVECGYEVIIKEV